jgi:hypothetical protein
MISRTLARRLERLEDDILPADELKVWQIVITDSDGTETLGDRIEWSPRTRQGKRVKCEIAKRQFVSGPAALPR